MVPGDEGGWGGMMWGIRGRLVEGVGLGLATRSPVSEGPGKDSKGIRFEKYEQRSREWVKGRGFGIFPVEIGFWGEKF